MCWYYATQHGIWPRLQFFHDHTRTCRTQKIPLALCMRWRHAYIILLATAINLAFTHSDCINVRKNNLVCKRWLRHRFRIKTVTPLNASWWHAVKVFNSEFQTYKCMCTYMIVYVHTCQLTVLYPHKNTQNHSDFTLSNISSITPTL